MGPWGAELVAVYHQRQPGYRIAVKDDAGLDLLPGGLGPGDWQSDGHSAFQAADTDVSGWASGGLAWGTDESIEKKKKRVPLCLCIGTQFLLGGGGGGERWRGGGGCGLLIPARPALSSVRNSISKGTRREELSV